MSPPASTRAPRNKCCSAAGGRRQAAGGRRHGAGCRRSKSTAARLSRDLTLSRYAMALSSDCGGCGGCGGTHPGSGPAAGNDERHEQVRGQRHGAHLPERCRCRRQEALACQPPARARSRMLWAETCSSAETYSSAGRDVLVGQRTAASQRAHQRTQQPRPLSQASARQHLVPRQAGLNPWQAGLPRLRSAGG